MQIQHPQQKLPAGESGQSSPAATTLAAPSSSTTIFTNQQQQLQSLSHSSWNGGGSGGSQQLYPKPTENERNFNADDQEGFPTLPSMDQLEQTHLHHGEEEEEPSPSISMLFAGEVCFFCIRPKKLKILCLKV
jgi:hypothetical protein